MSLDPARDTRNQVMVLCITGTSHQRKYIIVARPSRFDPNGQRSRACVLALKSKIPLRLKRANAHSELCLEW